MDKELRKRLSRDLARLIALRTLTTDTRMIQALDQLIDEKERQIEKLDERS
jgi:hypothetical protein